MPSVYQEARTIVTGLKVNGVIVNKQMAPAKMAVVRILTKYRSKLWDESKSIDEVQDSDVETLVRLIREPIPKFVLDNVTKWELTDLLNYLTKTSK